MLQIKGSCQVRIVNVNPGTTMTILHRFVKSVIRTVRHVLYLPSAHHVS